MLVERLKAKFKPNEPIFAYEIIELFPEYTRAYIYRLMDQADKNKELIKFDTGIYFLPTKSKIGFSTITAEDVVNKKYIQNNDEVYGVYSGLKLQNMFSVTSQMPNTIEIVTNKESMRCRKVIVDGRTVILRKSRCIIDKENAYAYTVVQLMSEIDINIDDRAKASILQYMKKNDVKSSDLLTVARYFPAKTTKNLLYSGVLNDFT